MSFKSYICFVKFLPNSTEYINILLTNLGLFLFPNMDGGKFYSLFREQIFCDESRSVPLTLSRVVDQQDDSSFTHSTNNRFIKLKKIYIFIKKYFSLLYFTTGNGRVLLLMDSISTSHTHTPIAESCY